MSGWLSSLRVIDLTDERGLLAGQMLAKLGADVIQIEPVGGSSARRVGPFDDQGRSFFWSAYAAGKRGVVLDLETMTGLAQLHRLLASADILLESASPGWMADHELGFEALHKLYPALVHVTVTPFGSTGPKRHWAASDLTLWAAGGPLHPHRDVEGPPLRISATQAWLHGAADAATGAMIAYLSRQTTGRGQHVDVSVQQAISPSTLSLIAGPAVGHPDYILYPRPVRPAEDVGKPNPMLGPKWHVADGLVELTIGGGPAGQRSNLLFDWMRAEGALPPRFENWDWTKVPMRIAPDDPMIPDLMATRHAVAAFLAPKTKAVLEHEAITRHLLLAPIKTTADLLASAHHKARGYFVTVEEDGVARTLPGAFALGPDGMFVAPSGAPTLDQHTEEVFSGADRPSVQSATAPPAARPLEGLKVLDLAWVVAGPALGRAMADCGATVVRVESSVRIETARLMGPFWQGNPDPQRSALYDTYNVGKLGLALDLTHPDGQAVVRDLAQWADVVVESFIPGQLAKWGLSPEALRAANPRLVVTSTCLMGQTGPAAALSGYGNIGAAMAGYQAIVGRIGEPPIGPFGPYTDFVGPRFGLLATLAAIDRQRRTGEGCWLDISQAEAGMQFLAPLIAETAATGQVAASNGNRDPQFAPHGVFACAGDDRWIAIVARDDAEWARLAVLIGGTALDPEFVTLAGRKADEDRLDGVVATWTANHTAEDLEMTVQALGVPIHRAATPADINTDPQLIARGHFGRVPHPLGGDCVFETSRYQMSDTPAHYQRAAPHFGRDKVEVLQNLLGYKIARVDALEAAGVLR